jgi:valyl-tRNA synthetase
MRDSGAPMSKTIPEKYDHKASEKRWGKEWSDADVYAWDPSRPRNETFVVDTPPPTVSGSLHLGHVFSYTQTDIITRYQRMRGKNIAYPMGWDDNGLPTERRVQNVFNIQCNPKLPYIDSWKPAKGDPNSKEKPVITEVSRKNFVEACEILTQEDEVAFEDTFKQLALSIDWSRTYTTINEHCRHISQLSFLDLIEKGQAYNVEAPTMWDVDFRSAVAQAEVEDREVPGAFHDIEFGVEGGGSFIISTTRPELLPACIAVVAHPEDKRYKGLFGKYATTPLFKARVPILPAEHADPEKGSGILMVCTFGDAMDVEWWKRSGLPAKQIVSLKGSLKEVEYGAAPFESTDVALAKENYSKLAGLDLRKAKKVIAEMLAQPGTSVVGSGAALQGAPRPISHAVKFYEKGDRPLEFVTTRQWFIKTMAHKDALIAQGRKIHWHPEHMRHRYENWVTGLNTDWCISRQRFFGIPFPVWYPVNTQGEIDYDKPIFAKREALPIDPYSDVPPGYTEAQRNQPGGFVGDPDVMDTWATSSLTPQIQSEWLRNPEKHKKLFPMDIRPQAHEIIRTWAFTTIVKAWMHDNEVPWRNIVISGWVLDPDRKKMSKSKGNVITPQHLFDEYSTDAVRYWAGRARLGADTATDPAVFKIGSKLMVKLFNASRFVLMQLTDPVPGVEKIRHPLDKAMVSTLVDVVKSATKAFDEFDYALALQVTEEAFWHFCDHYVELVKGRSYSETDTEGRESAHAALYWCLKTFIRLFAPCMPYITEEVWSWRFTGSGKDRFVHATSWPSPAEVADITGDPASFQAAVEVVSAIRATKTMAQKGQRWGVSSLSVKATKENLEILTTVLDDVIRAGSVIEGGTKLVPVENTEGSRFGVEVVLSEA